MVKRNICLDIGCGSGRSYGFNPHCPVHTESILLDVEFPSNDIIRFVSSRASLHFVVASAEMLPFRENVFNIVHMWHSLEHTLCDVCCLHEIYRVSSRNSEIMIVVPSRLSVDCERDPSHRHCYRFLTLSKTVRRIGLKVSLVHRCGSKLPKPVRIILNMLFNELADHIYLRLTK